jgi:hypothetical protein
MFYRLRLVASTCDKPGIPGLVRAAIEKAGGCVEAIGTDRVGLGGVELTVDLRMERSHQKLGIIGAVEKLPRVAVMRVIDSWEDLL